ncbi:mRNA export factor MEX67 [Wickerhamomyces ciferrii]|uniref:mRNA export factor MEX67 n=1 Tax=Wickerhamomyces ciferrii (strain ATCC 14091 / BCRC 22168 / CBS 111 / JCM 3599 / NBRC 0793 / NRRL Y-1031 F-60-10) TaxID=1206466 RepID=K0KJ11_WICCF|nr:mRNA export factor MEX67 [Wickerhamomyces ciferrii]CCH42961.1 mRNA export factor MEX67 [Wickerhamomyces ciferrii]
MYRGRGSGGYRGGRGGYQRSNGAGADGMEIEGGVRNNGAGNGGRITGPGEQLNQLANQAVQQNSVPVEVRGWQGGSKDDLVSFISRKTRIPLLNAVIEGDAIKGFVKTNRDAEDLKKWSGVRFAGNALKIELPSSGQQGSAMVLLKGFLHRRYNANAKLLDLTNISSDADLQQNGAFSSLSVQSKMFPALMKLASMENFDVESVNLSENNLDDISGITTLAQTFPNLKNLALTNNKISKLRSFEIWKNKFKNLRELIIAGNPVTTDPQYKPTIAKVFPRLVILDGIMIRDEGKLQLIYQLPILKKQFFFEDSEIQTLSTQFVSNFLQFWDSDRTQLLQLYSPQSQFSISVDSSVPNDSNASQISFGYYIPISRNLSRVSSERTRQQRLGTGPESILKLFQNIPKTKHSLTSNPELYSMEAWRFPQVNGFIISLHGEFEEVGHPATDANQHSNSSSSGRGGRRGAMTNSSTNRLTKKSFDREFVVVPANGSLIIASDLLIIRPWSNHQSFVETTITPPPTGEQQPIPPQSQGSIPGSSQAQIPPSSSQQQAPSVLPTSQQQAQQIGSIPQELSHLSPTQQEFVMKVIQDTKLNLQFSLLLSEQSSWNYEIAINGFKESHQQGQIPPEAFM